MRITENISLIVIIVMLTISISSIAIAQASKPLPARDSTIVFGKMELTPNPSLQQDAYRRAFGLNIMISTNGFGAGLFYRREFSDVISAAFDVTVSESRDDDEKEFTDIYGRPISIGKVNRFLIIPMIFSIEKRVFKDDILDNFRPYLTGGVGPTMIYVFPYNEEYFSALGKGQLKYTFGGYIGAGAFFGSERSSLLGLNLRYYYVPYYSGIESLEGSSKTQFGGVYISLSFGSAW